MLNSRPNPGFSVLEAILVLGVVAVLTISSLLIIKPINHLAKAKNAQRAADINLLISSIYQYANDHHGHFPVCIDRTVRHICADSDCAGLPDACNLHQLVGVYITAIPIDPLGPQGKDSRYDVQMTAEGRIIVSAPQAEQLEPLRVSR